MIRAVKEVITTCKEFYVEYRINSIKYTSKVACADHLIDRELGGSNHQENIVLACRKCNNRKEKMKSQLAKRNKLDEYIDRIKDGFLEWRDIA